MRDSKNATVFTIGHSLHEERSFASLLALHAIDVILDVRSSPYSRRAPQYSRPSVGEWLRDLGVEYVFAGRRLGGRPEDPALYEGTRASYARMAQWPEFRVGLNKVVVASRRANVALMCAEADPLECHRFLLIGRQLHEKGVEVQHVLPDGRLESHRAGEKRLIQTVGLAQAELFSPRSDVVNEAYSLQESRFAFDVGMKYWSPESREAGPK